MTSTAAAPGRLLSQAAGDRTGLRLPPRSRGIGTRLSADEIASTLTGGRPFTAPVCHGVAGIREPDACPALAQFLSHSPPYGTVRHRSPGHHQATSRAVTAACGYRPADLESVLGNVWRVRISNPQLAVTEARAPRVMLEGCPNNSHDPAMPNGCRNQQQELSVVSIFAAQPPIGCGLPGCLQDGRSSGHLIW